MKKLIFTMHSYAKDAIRYLNSSLQGKLTNVPLSIMSDEFGFALDSSGWNFYNDLLSERFHNPDIPLKNTRFFHFFNHPKINSIQYFDELLFLHDPYYQESAGSRRFYLGTYPWGGLTKADSAVGGIPFGWFYDENEDKDTKSLWGYGRNLWYQPCDQFTLEEEDKVTQKVYESLTQGYYPYLYCSFPSVAMLIRNDSEKRALILDGHHRLSALSFLGYQNIKVEITEEIKESEVDRWFYVQQGDCTKKRALEIFYAFFEINGRERVEALEIA